MPTLIHFIQNAKQLLTFQVFTIYLRYLVGGGFIMAAFNMGKISGDAMPIAGMDLPIQDLQPIQLFFRVMVMSGMYWKFIGWTQIFCGILLMTQKWAKLGAVIFFGIILNIFLITVAYDFTGTPIIAGLMLLAAVYLLLWDLKDLQYIFSSPDPHEVAAMKEPAFAQSPYWIWVGAIMLLSVGAFTILKQEMLLQIAVPFLEGLLAFIVAMFNIKKIKEAHRP